MVSFIITTLRWAILFGGLSDVWLKVKENRLECTKATMALIDGKAKVRQARSVLGLRGIL